MAVALLVVLTGVGPISGEAAAGVVPVQAHGAQAALVDSLTDQFSTTIAEPDGSFTSTVSISPRRVWVAEESRWADIDLTLVSNGTTFGPRVGGHSVELSDGVGAADEPLARVATDGSLLARGRLRSGVVGRSVAASDPSMRWGWPGSRVRPVVVGDRAVYRGVAAGLSLSVSAMSNGVHVGFAMSRSAAKRGLRIPLGLSNVRAVDTKAVGIELRDRSGRTIGGIGQVVVGDSSAGKGSGGESKRVVAARVRLVGKGSQRVLSISVPRRLRDHRRVQFPLVGSVIGWEGTTNAGYVDKAYPNVNSPDADYPAKKGLKVGSWSSGHEDYSFLRFPSSTFRPSGSVLNSASLRVWGFHAGACSGKMLVRRILNTAGNDWTAGSVTWSNKPTGTSSGEASTTVSKGANTSCADGWIPGSDGLNVTSVIEPWWGSDPNNQNNGLLLRAESTATAQYKILRGYDTTHPPELTVNYTLRPGVPSVPQILSPIVNGEIKSTAVQVSAWAPAYAGTGMVMLFRVWRVAQGYCTSNPSECIDSALIPVSSGQSVTASIPLPDDSGYSVSAITMVQRPNGSWVDAGAWANNPTRFAIDTLPDIEDEVITPISGLSAFSPYYVPTATPSLSVRLVQSVPNESFSTVFRVKQLKQNGGTVGEAEFSSPPQPSTGSGTVRWSIPAGRLVNGRSYEWEVIVTETHPNQHTAAPSGGPPFRVNEQAVCSTIGSPPDGRAATRCAKA